MNINTHWKSSNGPFSEIVYSISFNKNNICFCGTFSNGLYKSNESKTYWYKTYINNSYVRFIFSFENNIIVGTEKDLYISFDNGTSWKKLFLNLNTTSLAKDNLNTLYLGTMYNGIFYSKNSGYNWQKIGFQEQIIKSLCFYNKINKVLIGTEYGIFLYDENKFIKLNITSENINKIIEYNNKIFSISNNKIYILDENFQFEVIETSLKNIWDILIYKEKIFLSCDNGVFIYDNKNFIDISSGLSSKKVYCLKKSNDNFLYCGTFGWGIYKTNKNLDLLVSNPYID